MYIKAILSVPWRISSVLQKSVILLFSNIVSSVHQGMSNTVVAYCELVLWRVFSTSKRFHQYPGGYHQSCRRMPPSYSVTVGYHHCTMSWSYRGCLVHQSDFISTLEHIISTAEGCHSLIQSATGGYHQYTTGCATLWWHIVNWSYGGC